MSLGLALSFVILAEAVLYYSIYRSRYGCKAVYRTPHAWILDTLAIASGVSVSAVAWLVMSHPSFVTIVIHPLVAWWFFIIGSSQAMMHLIKWAIRIIHAE